MKRIDTIIIQYLITEYDDDGVPIGEAATPPTRVFVKSFLLPDAIRDLTEKINASTV